MLDKRGFTALAILDNEEVLLLVTYDEIRRAIKMGIDVCEGLDSSGDACLNVCACWVNCHICVCCG